MSYRFIASRDIPDVTLANGDFIRLGDVVRYDPAIGRVTLHREVSPDFGALLVALNDEDLIPLDVPPSELRAQPIARADQEAGVPPRVIELRPRPRRATGA